MEQAGPSTGKALAKPSGKRFEIKKWNAVAMWSWAICTDTCAICRNNLYEPSIEYQVHLYHTSNSHHAPSLLHARMQCLQFLPESAAGLLALNEYKCPQAEMLLPLRWLQTQSAMCPSCTNPAEGHRYLWQGAVRFSRCCVVAAGQPHRRLGPPRAEHSLGRVRACVPPRLHSEVAQDPLSMPAMQQGVGLPQDREDPAQRLWRGGLEPPSSSSAASSAAMVGCFRGLL